MNLALISLISIPLDSIIADLNPCIILSSNKPTKELQLADVGVQLDEKISFENLSIDVVCVINEDPLHLDNLKNFSPNDYLDRIYYTGKILHTSSFYCKPNVFSLISSLYKIDFDLYCFKDLENDSIELLTEKIFYVVNRLGIEVLYA